MSCSHESLPLNAHLASRRGLELNDAVLRHCLTGRDQLDECWPVRLPGMTRNVAEPLIQLHVVHPQRARDQIETVLPGECCGTDPAGVATGGSNQEWVMHFCCSLQRAPLATECDLNRAGYTVSRRLAENSLIDLI